jgi:NAD(P)H-flavin reductase
MLMMHKGLETIQRPYTPTALESTDTMDIIVKIYPDGKFTSNLAKLRMGAELKIRGPIRDSHILESFHQNPWSDVICLCTGTGITPVILALEYLFSSGRFRGNFVIISSFQSDLDVIRLKQLEGIESKYEGRVKMHVIVGIAGTQWTGMIGRITPEIIVHAANAAQLEYFNKQTSVKSLSSASLESYNHVRGKNLRILVCGTTNFSLRSKDMLRQLNCPSEIVTVF